MKNKPKRTNVCWNPALIEIALLIPGILTGPDWGLLVPNPNSYSAFNPKPAIFPLSKITKEVVYPQSILTTLFKLGISVGTVKFLIEVGKPNWPSVLIP